MKRIITFFLFSTLALNAFAEENQYRVKKVEGQVEYSSNGQKVSMGDYLKPEMTLRLGPSSLIRIVDINDYVYFHETEGKITVEEIANPRKKSVASLLVRMLNYTRPVSMETGVVKRSAQEPGIFLEMKEFETEERIKKIRVAANTDYYFNMGNISSEKLYFNLIRLNLIDKQAVALFNAPLPVESREMVELTDLVFHMPENTEYKFYLIASPRPIDSDALIKHISKNNRLENDYPDITYVWKELISD